MIFFHYKHTTTHFDSYESRAHPRRTLSRRALPDGHFPDWTLPRLGTSPNGHFPDWTLPRLDTSPTGHFPDWTIPRLDNSPTGQVPDRTSPRRYFLQSSLPHPFAVNHSAFLYPLHQSANGPWTFYSGNKCDRRALDTSKTVRYLPHTGVRVNHFVVRRGTPTNGYLR